MFQVARLVFSCYFSKFFFTIMLQIKPRYSFKRKEIRPGDFQVFNDSMVSFFCMHNLFNSLVCGIEVMSIVIHSHVFPHLRYAWNHYILISPWPVLATLKGKANVRNISSTNVELKLPRNQDVFNSIFTWSELRD